MAPNQLRRLTREVLDRRRPAHSLREEVLGIARILDGLASFESDPSRDIGAGETSSDAGLALSPAMAALCAQDYARTVVFLRGLHAAIAVALDRARPRRIRVLYAGCGPYALLAVPLMASLRPEEVRFDLLDLHRESIDSARGIVDALGFAPFVAHYSVVDACRHRIPSDQLPQVIVSETMNAALEGEPQVAIARHLLRQAPEAILVPSLVRIDAALIDPAKEFVLAEAGDAGEIPEPTRDRILLGTVFELSAESIESWSDEHDPSLPGAWIELPEVIEGHYAPMLLTTIEVFGDNRLSDYDSGLTLPRRFPARSLSEAGRVLQFRYRLGARPGLTVGPSEDEAGG